MNWDVIRMKFEAIVLQSASALALLVLVSLVYFFASRGLSLLMRRRTLAKPIIIYTRKALRWIAALAALLLVLQSFGLLHDAWAMLTAIMAMVAIGFVAVWSVLSNTLCSAILLIARPFQVGDRIELPPDGLKGKVVNFNMLFTTLKSDDDVAIQIPNNVFFQRVILRQRGGGEVRLDEQLLEEADATA